MSFKRNKIDTCIIWVKTSLVEDENFGKLFRHMLVH